MSCYWYIPGFYRGSSNCSVPPNQIWIRSDTQPTATPLGGTLCESRRYSFSGTNLVFIFTDGSEITNSTLVNGGSYYSNVGSAFYSCSNPANQSTQEQPYDCINGACFPASEYNTPGLYLSLAECEQACGIGCSGKCLSNNDWAQITGLAAQLKNKNCS